MSYTPLIYHGTPMTPRMALLDVLAGRAACVSFYRPDDVAAVEAVCPGIMYDNGAISPLARMANWLGEAVMSDDPMSANARDGDIVAYDAFIVRYPFVREKVSAHWSLDWAPDAAPPEIMTWRPGIVYEQFGPEDVEAVAHGQGEMHLRVISEHKPGRYPARVFYERHFVDPDGKAFGSARLHVATREKFNRLCRGYAHPYDIYPPHPTPHESEMI